MKTSLYASAILLLLIFRPEWIRAQKKTSQTRMAAASSRCDKMSWARWNFMSGRSATGSIDNKGVKVGLTANASFDFKAEAIWEYEKFTRFPSPMPDTKVPSFTWTRNAGGKVTLCFSQKVKNPVLMVATLGRHRVDVTLKFSRPYEVVYDGGRMVYHNSTSMTGKEGNALIRFKGEVSCVTVVSNRYEEYTSLTWGLPALCEEPIKPVAVKTLAKATIKKPVLGKKPAVPAVKIKAKADIVPAKVIAASAGRNIPKTPALHEGRLKVQIWDFDCMDFDSVCLKFNDKPVGAAVIQLPLYKRYARDFTYALHPLTENNKLEIYAVSEGVKPLVSIGLLIMYDGKHRKAFYEIKPRESVVIYLDKER